MDNIETAHIVSILKWITSSDSILNNQLVDWMRHGNSPNNLLDDLFYVEMHTILPDQSFSSENIRAYFSVLSSHLPDCIHFLPVEFDNDALTLDYLVNLMNDVDLNDGRTHYAFIAIHLMELTQRQYIFTTLRQNFVKAETSTDTVKHL